MSLRESIYDAIDMRKAGLGIKAHETLPALLIFAVVAADLMSTPMYVVGLLGRSIGPTQWVYLAALSALLGLLLPFYFLVMTRYAPHGGGVASLGETAFHPLLGQIGSWMMVTDYSLTVAISAASAVYYVTAFFPGFPTSMVVLITLVLIASLWYLNILGVKEGAGVALKATVGTLAIYVVVVVLAGFKLDTGHVETAKGHVREVFNFGAMGGWAFFVGFSAKFSSAFLALTGLESGAQIAHHVREPKTRHAKWGLFLVWLSFILTPLLGLMASLLLSPKILQTKGDYLLAELARLAGGPWVMGVFVAAGGLILAFAANTGMIGYNAVLLKLAQTGNLPGGLLKTGKRGTPVLSISIVAITSAAILVMVQGNMEMLGHLYAFGVVGSVLLTLVSILKIRLFDEEHSKKWITALVALASLIMALVFVFNLVYKPEAAILGSLVVVIGLGVSWANRRYGKTVEVAITRSLAPVASRVVYGHLHEHKLDVFGDSIIVATRGGAHEVIKMASELASLRGAELYILYVCETPLEWRKDEWTPADDPRGEEVVEHACVVAREYGISPHPVHVVASNAGIAIVELIHALDCKTLVMGLPTRGRIERLVRGDVVKFVENHRPTDCHILYYSP